MYGISCFSRTLHRRVPAHACRPVMSLADAPRSPPIRCSLRPPPHSTSIAWSSSGPACASSGKPASSSMPPAHLPPAHLHPASGDVCGACVPTHGPRMRGAHRVAQRFVPGGARASRWSSRCAPTPFRSFAARRCSQPVSLSAPAMPSDRYRGEFVELDRVQTLRRADVFLPNLLTARCSNRISGCHHRRAVTPRPPPPRATLPRWCMLSPACWF